MFVVKHYHIIALFLIFFSVGSFYEAFHDGELGRSLWTGIGWTLFALFVLFYDKLRSWLQPIFVALVFIYMGVMLLTDANNGYIAGAIVWGVSLIFLVSFLYYRPFFEGKARPRTIVVTFIVYGVLFILTVAAHFTDGR